MAEKYVSVSELRKLLGIPSDGQCTGCQFSTFHGCKDDSIQRACEAIDDAPEADVRPVVRGKWVRGNENRTSPIKDSYICSVCGEKTLSGFCGNPAKTNFCPNCGADMREVKTNEK